MVILPKSESSDLVGIVIKEKEMKNKKKIKKRAKTRENLYKKKKKNPSIEKQLIKFVLIGKKNIQSNGDQKSKYLMLIQIIMIFTCI